LPDGGPKPTCGVTLGTKCLEGGACTTDADCNGACSYAGRCVDSPSCKPHLGGDTCGKGEVGEAGALHENCCRTLPVSGYADAAHPGKQVYLDKYEITTGRVRAFLEAMSTKYGGKPNVQQFVSESAPFGWQPQWSQFLPADKDGGPIIVNRLLLGDRRDNEPPELQPPATDQPRNTGTDWQFNGSIFVYLHGNNCGTQATSYGFPTFFYPGDVLAKMGANFPPRADGKDAAGNVIPASEHLDVKSMNCITNAMLAAFCAWDGGQLASDEVLDYVTGSLVALGDQPGCGTQIGTEYPPTTDASMKGGRCADLDKINATFDAGGQLPTPTYPGNTYHYIFPFFAETVDHDKAWEVAAPGRGTFATNKDPVDMVRINAADEPWMDLAGNLSEAVMRTKNGVPSGKFGLKYRGIGYQSARSELNMRTDWEGEGGLRRIERGEAKAGFTGGRCMRFR